MCKFAVAICESVPGTRHKYLVSSHNIEQLSARLLNDLTRNTGFEVTKSNLGECW